MSDDRSAVKFERRGNTAVITLNRPDSRNAFNLAMTSGIEDAVARLEADDTLRVGVMRGAGKVFCAGMDLKAFAGPDRDRLLHQIKTFAGMGGTRRRKPLIAAVQGAALAGGFEIALACDIIVAARGARFGLPEVLRGLVAGAGGAFRIGQRLPAAKARELLLTGGTFDADQALRWGVVADVVEETDLEACALALAERIGENAPLAVQASLRLANAAIGFGEQDLWALNEEIFPGIAQSEDAQEGARAFVEKRTPVWTGR